MVLLYTQVVSFRKPSLEAVLYRALWAIQGFACCTKPHGLYEALRAVRSLTGCTKPYGLYGAL